MISESNELHLSQYDILTPTSATDPTVASLLIAPLTAQTPDRDAGLNPLVDAAARLFSIAGKLRRLKSCLEPKKLHDDLMAEINSFQETVKNLGYGPEYILVSRYALCATLDDILTQTTWGSEGQWQICCPQGLFGTDNTQNERFFVILERIIRDPKEYIDLMELMYICLSLGFRGHYQATEFGHHRLEQISDTLYRQIRAHHGDFTRTLSPFPVKAPTIAATAPPPFSTTWILLLTASIILLTFAGFGLALDAFSNKAHTKLAEIGTLLHHETFST